MSDVEVTALGREDPDGVFLGWGLLWSLVLMITVASMLAGGRATEVPMQQQFSLGLAMGSLSAIWAAIGSWVNLIEIPAVKDSGTRSDGAARSDSASDTPLPELRQPEQRHGPRFQVGGVLVFSAIVFGFAIRQDLESIAQISLSAILAVAIVLVVMQWTGRRLHRGPARQTKQKSIRQIMRLTTTIAILVAVLKLTDDKLGLSSEMLALVVSLGVLWGGLMFLLLGRYWWLMLLSIPLVVLQLMGVSLFFDSQSRNLESDLSRFSGTVVGFYVLAILVLGLMRSSGHRWFGIRR